MSWIEKTTRGNVSGFRPAKEDTRTPLYMLYGVDCSGSMSEPTTVIEEGGSELRIPKIDQANDGMEQAVRSMLRFQRENTRFRVKWQVVELDTYCKPVFDTYVNLDENTLNSSKFEADGSTHIEALFTTFSSFITQKHLGRYNRPLNIILLSDGIPTDVNGRALSEEKWKNVVDRFKDYLEQNDFSRSVEFYFIAVGEEAEAFGRYFAGEHFFRVEESESLADKIDFVTRQSLADSTTIPYNAIGYTSLAPQSDDEDEYDEEDDWEGLALPPAIEGEMSFADPILFDESEEEDQEGETTNETDQETDVADEDDEDDGGIDDLLHF